MHLDQDSLTLFGYLDIDLTPRGGDPVTVRIREITVGEILGGPYVDHLMADYGKALALVCTIDGEALTPAFLESLPRVEWTRLRETEEAVNFSFAVAEIKAAHARGEALKVVKEQALALYREMTAALSGQASSSTTAASPAKPPSRPAPEPSDGSPRPSAGPRPSSSPAMSSS
jgi:hypothetical protein